MKKLVLFIIFSILIPQFTYAYSVEPLSWELRPSGAEASKVFYVENNDPNKKIAVQVTASTRGMDIDGKEIRNPTDHFVIYPDQLVVNSREKRAVRVTYTGPRDLKAEAAYRITFGELPVELKKPEPKSNGAQINFMFNYNTAVYVAPFGFKADAKVESINRLAPDKLEVIFANPGTAHQSLSSYDFKLVDSATSKAFSIIEEELKTLRSINLLAGTRFKTVFKLPVEAKSAKNLTVQMAIRAD